MGSRLGAGGRRESSHRPQREQQPAGQKLNPEEMKSVGDGYPQVTSSSGTQAAETEGQGLGLAFTGPWRSKGRSDQRWGPFLAAEHVRGWTRGAGGPLKRVCFSEKNKHPPSSVKPFPSPSPGKPCLCTVSDAVIIIVHACLVAQLCPTLCNPMNCI